MKAIYEPAAETAKKIRRELKNKFPGVKFSVTSKSYSLGSSVYVSWSDGPGREEVCTVTNRFESSTFDGMTDMATSHGYMYEGQLYNGADYILVQRNESKELTA